MRSEDKCKRCGKCCIGGSVCLDGKVRLNMVPCEHWNRETRLCAIYAERECLTSEEGVANRLMPRDCGYVGDGYEPLVEEFKDDEAFKVYQWDAALEFALNSHFGENVS